MRRNAFIRVFCVALAVAMLAGTGCKPKAPANSGGGKPLPKIELLYNTSEGHKLIAEAIQQMWKKNLGVEVRLVNKEWKVYLKDVVALDYQMARAGWVADYNDPNTYLDMFVTEGGNNNTGWSDKDYDALIAKAATINNPEERMKVMYDAESLLIKELPIMPIYFYTNINMLKPKVKGMHFNIRDQHPLKDVYIEKAGKPVPDAQQVFTFNNGTEPETLDPAKMTGNPEHTIAASLFEGLVTEDPKTLAPRPGVAEKWEVSPDGVTYTFHLRKNAKWTDGSPVTSADFLYSWLRALDPKTASDYVYQFYYIKNARPYYEGKIKDAKQVGITAPDPQTLVVTLEHPTPFFLDLVAFPVYLPVNRKCVEKYGDGWTRRENIVSNGPFKMAEWKPRDKIVLVKDPANWDAKNVRLQKAVAISIDDNLTSLNMYDTDKTDWIRTVPLQLIEKMKPRKDFYATPFLSTYYYRFNVKKPPFDDVRVRRAFNMAVNKADICKYVTKAGQIPATSFVPLVMPGYKGPKGDDYNPEEARKLLREAGYAVNVP